MSYSINEFARRVGLTAHTLRYYEKENLLTPSRLSNTHRTYSDRDAEWIRLILRLKDTGMPLKKIKQFAILRAQGDSTFAQRRKILIEHQKYVDKAIDEWLEHREKLAEKIEHYDLKCG